MNIKVKPVSTKNEVISEGGVSLGGQSSIAIFSIPQIDFAKPIM